MTPEKSLQPIQEIIFQTIARYLTVRPYGIEVAPDRPPVPALEVRVLSHGGARSLYRGRRPVCRSLDGVAAIRDPEKLCVPCPDRKHCTPQVRVDLLFEGQPYRLLLSYTSARNFLQYIAEAKARRRDLIATRTRIKITNRGSWGEVRFQQVPDAFTAARTSAPVEQP